jgi:hypothetical protein
MGKNICDFNFSFSQKRLRSMMNDDATTRYAKFLEHYQEISHRIPQYIIASHLGITPQSLSRLRKIMDVLENKSNHHPLHHQTRQIPQISTQGIS